MGLLSSPQVLNKMRKYNRTIDKLGFVSTVPRGFFLNYSNACNFKCQQCFTESPIFPVKGTLTVESVKTLSDQADEMGMFEVIIEGGEPLIIPELFEIIGAIGSERFNIGITTNGYLLDELMAQRLSEAGVARIIVSLDSTEAKIHDEFRGVQGAYAHALKALQNAKKEGMSVSVNFLVGHYNAQSKEIEDICEFCEKNGYQLGLIVATPTGNWRGHYDVMLDDNDSNRLQLLRKKYRNIWRDIWPLIDTTREKVSGCLAVNRPYINPYGEVLPCSYLHMTLGNVLEKPFKEILDEGFKIKHFSCYQKKCYAGEDELFVKKYLNKEMSILKPVSITEIFDQDDFE